MGQQRPGNCLLENHQRTIRGQCRGGGERFELKFPDGASARKSTAGGCLATQGRKRWGREGTPYPFASIEVALGKHPGSGFPIEAGQW